MPPETIAGRYHLLREIGRGGMGAVFLCRDERLGREVAIKQVGGLPGETAPQVARALREARASAALNHPNVVSIYDAVEDHDHVWLVMEHVPSRTLSELVAQEGSLSPQRAAFICAQVADGLAAAHEGGTVHRDVKPSNVLVGAGDVTKISDFGIARHVDDETLTQSGMVTGTPQYFSPQLARGQSPEPADDVWALGATLFRVLEGRSPWQQEENPLAVLAHIKENPPPTPTAAGPLTELVIRMMSTDRHRRPDMASVAAELHAVAAGPVEKESATLAFPAPVPEPAPEPAASAPASTVEREPAPAPAAPAPAAPDPGTPRRDRPGWLLPVAAAAAVLLLLGVIGAALLLDDSGEEDPSAQDTTGADTAQSEDPTGSEEAPRTAESTEATTEPTSEPTTETTSEATATDAAQVVEDYYALLPGDTKAAWDYLSDEMQAEVGSYGSYRGFWSTIDAVSVDGTSDDGSGAVTVELTYTSSAGTESETRLITVEDTGEGPQIVGDQVV